MYIYVCTLMTTILHTYIALHEYKWTIMYSHSKVRRHHKNLIITHDHNTVGNGTITSLMMI